MIVAQLLLYPPLSPDLDGPSATENATGFELTTEAMAFFWREYLASEDPHDPLAAPLHASSFAGVAPAVIACSEFDPLRDDAVRYAELLGDAGVDVRLIVPAGLIHGFARWPALVPAARDALAETLGEFTRMIDGLDD